MKRIFLSMVSLCTLAGCGQSDKDDTSPITPPSFTMASGIYQAVNISPSGEPTLWQANLISPQNISLQQWDGRDQQEQWQGSFADTTGEINFDNQQICRQQDKVLSCTLKDQQVDLLLITPAVAAVSSLTGRYQQLIEQVVAMVKIEENGSLSGQWRNCSFSGKIARNQLLSIEIIQSDCQGLMAKGVIQTEHLYEQLDTLQVTLPGSALSGSWFKDTSH
ncbi:hypothetical protein ACRN9T_21505 [Shewanella baltica]|uniref:hypothetical protein n=1 Tax=Shewanella baltica TaxID=62322 RepID=UPI003D78F6A4